MSTPYIGEIRMFGGNFAPVGWHLCDGTLLPISQYDAVFNLIGTTYGGDGQNTFGLPDLQGRLPLHQASGFALGQSGGAEEVTLTAQQLPAHTHSFVGTTDIATQRSPIGNVLAQSTVAQMYIEDIADQALASNAIGPAGGSQPHSNLQPYLCINFIIALEGVYPSQS